MKLNIYILAIASLALASCGSKKAENENARQLINEAQMEYDQGRYAQSLALLDSLQKSFPGELDIQREGMGLRPKAIEQQAKVDIAVIDSLTKIDTATMTALKPSLKWIKDERMIEGYWVDAKSYNSSFMNSSAIQPRVSEIGQFYIVSSVNPAGRLHHTQVAVTANGSTATTSKVPYDGESNYRIGGGEVITFSPEQCDTIGAFVSSALAANPAATFTLSFVGDTNKTIKLTDSQAKGIAKTWEYSQAVIRARENQVHRQRLEKTIELARRQQGIAE